MSCWEIGSSYNGLRFFAELSKELLSFYSHDSFKVPTLNFHFLCYEIISTFADVDDEILDKGNLLPLFREFVVEYKKDPIVTELYGSKIDNLFSSKTSEGDYKSNFAELEKNPTSEATLQKLRHSCEYLKEDLSRGARYFTCCIARIRELVLTPNLEYAKLETLYQYTRIVLTELINIGYSQEYIYSTVNNVFFNDEKPVNDAAESFDSFVGKFTCKDREYVIYLPLNNFNIKKELSPFGGIEIEENVYEMFGGKYSYVIKIRDRAKDPEKAKISAVSSVDFCLSITQYSKHNKKKCTFNYAEVVDVDTKEVFELSTSPTLISRQKRSPIDIKKLAISCIDMGQPLFGAIGMHASAFSSKEPQNQLLNLWTAMEVLIPIERNGSMSKVVQIANAASTILSCGYIKSLIERLDNQLYESIGDEYNELLSDINAGADIRSHKLLAAIVLSKYSDVFDSICNCLENVPLCAYRMQQYKDCFSSCDRIKTFYYNHSKRVSWQIMRIYRSRNIIVHDGSAMPFLGVILQNLHFYIDTIVDKYLEKCGEGLLKPISIIEQYTHNEQMYFDRLKQNEPINENNFEYLIFGNGG